MATRRVQGDEVARMWGNLEGIVWALRLKQIPIEVILARVQQTNTEFDPSLQAAFTTKPPADYTGPVMRINPHGSDVD